MTTAESTCAARCSGVRPSTSRGECPTVVVVIVVVVVVVVLCRVVIDVVWSSCLTTTDAAAAARDGFVRGKLRDKEGEVPASVVETLRRGEVAHDVAPAADADARALRARKGA